MDENENGKITRDIWIRKIEEICMKNGYKLTQMNDKVGQIFITFYKKPSNLNPSNNEPNNK